MAKELRAYECLKDTPCGSFTKGVRIFVDYPINEKVQVVMYQGGILTKETISQYFKQLEV